MEIGDVSFYSLFPIIIFTISICGYTLYRSISRTNYEMHRFVGATLTLTVSFIVLVSQLLRWRQFDIGKLGKKDLSTLNGLVRTDRISEISIVIICIVAMMVTLVTVNYLKEREDIPAAEFYILLQVAIVGMFSMVMANDLIAMFVALEVFSIPLYVLTAFDRRRVRSLEGGFKYFILGAVSSAIFLYGIALHYGVSGSTALGPATEVSALAGVSTILILVGLLFKVASFPFHFWSPDAYQGAPTPVTMFMAAATKLTAFVALIRLVDSGVIDVSPTGTPAKLMLTLACIASAIFGSVVALRQANLKRAIAYSSIAHSAYILLALKGGDRESLQAVGTYVIAYALVIAGTFAIVSVLAGSRESGDSIVSVKGLAKTNPVLAGCLTILLFSQAGIPLTSGFIAKFEVFRTAFANEFYVSGIFVLISTVIAAAFYLRIVLAMYSESFGEEVETKREKYFVPTPTAIAIGVAVVATLSIGIFPELLTGFTRVL